MEAFFDKEIGTIPCFSAIFVKENVFEFLFHTQDDIDLLKGVCS